MGPVGRQYGAGMDDETAWDRRRKAVVELLQDGPQHITEVADHLEVRGLLDEFREELADDGFPVEDVAEALADDIVVTDELWITPDRVLALSDHLTDTMVLTHRLTPDELESGEVRITPDLVILDWNTDGALELAGGGELQHLFGDLVPGEDHSALAGPDGWLDGCEAGAVMAFTRRGTTIEVAPTVGLADDTREVELLTAAVDGRIQPGHGEEALPVVLDAITASLTADPPAFRRPVRPLGELLEAAGLERRGFSFGRAGEDWRSLREAAAEHERDQITRQWQFNTCCDRAFDQVHDAFDAFIVDGELDARTTNEALAHGAVAPAFASHVLDTEAGGDDELAAFAAALVAGAPKHAVPAHLLVAFDAERRGDATTAESALRTALRIDPGYGPAAPELALYELDRGHVDRAITLLRHPDLPGDQSVRFLESIRDRTMAPFRGVGRNEPCPCGSGRKFKVCCQRNPKVPLSARTSLVTHRLGLFAVRDHRRAHLIGVASSACDPDDPDLVNSLAAMAANPIISDFVVFEGGAAEEYLDERGPLLADDERDLIRQLIDEPRRLWEVTDVQRGAGLTLRDTRSGDVIEVTERLGSMDRAAGDLLLARVARLPDQSQVVGAPVEIPLRLRDSALGLVDSHPDADMLATWYGQAVAPPTLLNREGEPTVLCRVELATEAPPDDVRAALDGAFDSAGEDDTWTATWTAHDGDEVVRGHVSLGAGGIVIDTNSVERLERLLGTVTSAVPDATVVADERTDPREAMLRARLHPEIDEDDEAAFGSDLDHENEPVPPEVEDALEDFIRQKEMAWVDESIPALGGLTPRQALDDPTRREDLLTLLREMDDRPAAHPGGGRGFEASRIRALLGLEYGAS